MFQFIRTVLVTTTIALLFLIISVVTLLSYGVIRFIGIKKTAVSILQKGGRTLSRVIIRGMGGKVHIRGLENLPQDSKRTCIVSNHQSYIDIPLLVGYLPVWAGFIAKEELKKIPILKQWMESMGCVFIRRGSARSSIQMILDGVKRIEQGYPLIVFPEGTRSKSNRVNAFKEGSIKLATRSKAVIIPVTIQNSYQLWEKDLRVKAMDLHLIIHEPIDVSTLNEEEIKQLPRRVHGVIAEAAEVSGPLYAAGEG